ncbi:MAG TPA: hypothetical protein VK918_02395 [Pyrinomonadaceae bacterium]|nr:hypothetical protein [Pyrinomonadaceae bacterium]
MNLPRAAVALSILNLIVLVFLLTQTGTTSAQTDVLPLVRAKALEIVDEGGKVRAQIKVESNGEVIFRLRDSTGTIRSKYGADERGSALLLMDDRTEATVRIRANKDGGGLSLYDREGKVLEVGK